MHTRAAVHLLRMLRRGRDIVRCTDRGVAQRTRILASKPGHDAVTVEAVLARGRLQLLAFPEVLQAHLLTESSRVGLHITWGVDSLPPRFPKKHWEILKFHDFPLIFDGNLSLSMQTQRKIIDFQD